MKKILIGLVILGVILVMLWPVVVSADCYNRWYNVSYFNEGHNWTTERVSSFSAYTAAWDLGLKAGYNCFVVSDGIDYEPRTFWYRVSYFDDGHSWVTVLVEAESSEDAALQLGLRAGYDCFVGRVLGL